MSVLHKTGVWSQFAGNKQMADDKQIPIVVIWNTVIITLMN